jgi:hypothetical protein
MEKSEKKSRVQWTIVIFERPSKPLFGPYLFTSDVVLGQQDLAKVALADGANVCIALNVTILASVSLL